MTSLAFKNRDNILYSINEIGFLNMTSSSYKTKTSIKNTPHYYRNVKRFTFLVLVKQLCVSLLVQDMRYILFYTTGRPQMGFTILTSYDFPDVELFRWNFQFVMQTQKNGPMGAPIPPN